MAPRHIATHFEAGNPAPADRLAHPPRGSADSAGLDESLRRRESLLVASAAASRLLLEAPQLMEAVPEALRLVGEAAGVDRVDLMLSQPGPDGEPRLVVVSEWAAAGVVPRLGDPSLGYIDERNFKEICSNLRGGQTVCMNREDLPVRGGYRCGGLRGTGTKSKAIVPIFVEGEFVGVVGFDNCRRRRAIGVAELSALETAGGVIGAGLHRERLIDAVQRERARAAEERAAELLGKQETILRGLQQLAEQAELGYFLSGHVLVEAARQLEAACGAVVLRDVDRQEWRVVAHVRDGQVEPPPYSASVPLDVRLRLCPESVTVQAAEKWQPIYFELSDELERQCEWPGMFDFHRSQGHVGLLVLPLLFGQRASGYMALAFRRPLPEPVKRSDLLIALAQGATVAIELARLADSAKDAAVLAERNRIGQEIHDGLAQAFTGILMQLAATEGLDTPADGALAVVLARIRDLAREGLVEARRSVMALRPADRPRSEGLALALQQLAERSTVPGGVTCAFEGGGLATGLSPEHQHELLRIAQEAVGNAVRHGRPRNVVIAMLADETHWELAVTDDGRGMPQRPEQCARQGFGLANMRERANAIGGEWQIRSRKDEGTRVSVRLPKGGAS
jgi:signal transduction histidine kinase